MDKMAPFPGRVVERGRGCYNCRHYENGHLSKQKYTAVRKAEIAAAIVSDNVVAIPTRRLAAGIKDDTLLRAVRLTRKGVSQEDAIDRALGEALLHETARKASFDRQAETGLIGMCLKGKAPGDFVEAGYLCDGWDGRDGHSLATAGRPVDLLPEELREKLDGPAPERPVPDKTPK